MKRKNLAADYTDCLRMGLVIAVVFGFSSQCVAQQVVDKMIATVNAGVKTDLITYSDVLWQLALQPRTVLDNPTSEDLNRALRLLIDQRLILQEAEKLPTIVPTQKEVSDARDELARLPAQTKVYAAASVALNERGTITYPEPRVIHVLKRGDVRRKATEVLAAVPRVANPSAATPKTRKPPKSPSPSSKRKSRQQRRQQVFRGCLSAKR